MHWLLRVLEKTIVIALIAFSIDYALANAKHRRVSQAISQCGGRMHSLSAWPLGAEYRITFSRGLSSDQLDQLAELNALRGSVSVAFVDCNLSPQEVQQATEKLANCALYRVRDGELSALVNPTKALR